MKLLRYIPILCVLLLLPACTISGDLKADIVSGVNTGGEPSVLKKDLLAVNFNLENAVRVGALPASDPGLACVKSVLAEIGVGQEEVERFTPQVEGVFSAASILYIRAQQIKQERESPFKLSTECDAVVGRMLIDFAKLAGKTAADVLPGGGIVTGIVKRVVN